MLKRPLLLSPSINPNNYESNEQFRRKGKTLFELHFYTIVDPSKHLDGSEVVWKFPPGQTCRQPRDMTRQKFWSISSNRAARPHGRTRQLDGIDGADGTNDARSGVVQTKYVTFRLELNELLVEKER